MAIQHKFGKACFLIYNLEPGGLQHYLLRLLPYTRNDFDVTIIVKDGKRGVLYEKFINAGAHIHLMKVGYINIVAWYQIFGFFKAKQFHVVCDLTGNFAGIYLLLGKLAGVRVRIAKYGQSSNHFKAGLFRNLYNWFVNRLVFYNATCIVSNSIFALDFFFPYREVNDTRFHVIFNGIDNNLFSPGKDFTIRRQYNIPDTAFLIGNTGRFDEKKNQRTILKLAAKMMEIHDDVYFIISGYGTEGLMDEIIKLRLDKRVFAVGYRTDIPLLLKNFDAFYFPSLTEGQPNALIEALLTGLPIVASNIAPIREMICPILSSQVTDPMDVDHPYQLLMDIKNGMYPFDQKEIILWASAKFNSDVLFGEILKCMKGNC